ncbi:MAG: glycosyltransferase family 9 protein [Planctomycetota bacterium]
MTYLPKNILIIKPSALGDIVLALPALMALGRSFPDARISWLIRPEYAELVDGHPDLDEIILFDRRLLGRWWCNKKSFSNLSGLLRRLRVERFDLVFDFQGLFRTGFFARVTGCKKLIGMATSRELAHLFYTHIVQQDSACVHLVDYYLKMVEVTGAQTGRPEFKLPDDREAAEAVEKKFLENKVDLKNYVVIIPSAARKEKIWPIERFAQLADKIAEKYGSSIVATGSQGERQYIDNLVTKAKAGIINLAGQTTIRELTALLKSASLVVSNDTGPGHIAAALGVPLVMIFGPVNPARLCPYKRPECVAAVEPNTMGMAIDSRNPRYDIRHITVEQVFEKVCRQLRKV